MIDEMDLETATELLAETVEQEGVRVNREALRNVLEELGSEGTEKLLAATDPGGLLDAFDEMDADLLEWKS